MRTTVVRHPHREALGLWNRALIAAGLLWVMLVVGVQLARAAEPNNALAAVPATTAHLFSSHPMISGTVVTVNDHQMVVDTDQGERVTLEVDTHTMAPRDLAPGMVMRAEFLAREDCRLYAQRIKPIRGGMSTSRLQAYANTRDSREAMARNTAASGGDHWGSREKRALSAENQMSAPHTVGEHSPRMIMTATPATAAYRFSARPMLSGRVVSVNDHQLVVETVQGQRVGLVMDSRTMVPSAVAPGTMMRAEFVRMKDGRYYAKRVRQVGSGVVDREQAYAHTRDSDLLIAGNVPDCGFDRAVTPNAVASAVQPREAATTAEPAAVASEPVPVVERPETLPQTASHQPLLLLLGLFGLGSGGVIAWMRSVRPA